MYGFTAGYMLFSGVYVVGDSAVSTWRDRSESESLLRNTVPHGTPTYALSTQGTRPRPLHTVRSYGVLLTIIEIRFRAPPP